jgi:hypothetical protein
MDALDKVDILRIGAASGVGFAALVLAGAAFARIPTRAIYAAALLLGAGAATAWALFVLDPTREIGIAAAGVTAAALVAVAAIGVRRGAIRARDLEAFAKTAEARLQKVIERDAEERAAELERVLARARAESLSVIADEERRIVEERRATIAEREDVAAHELGEALAETQRRVELRLKEWGEDLGRAQGHLTDQLQRLAERQRRLIEEAEERLAADAERVQSESEGQRAALVKLREELGHATEQAIDTARGELDAHTAERRQALNELTERLHRRERELHEKVEREEAEAIQRIQGAFVDVERRLVERLERVVDKTTAHHADTAALQFAEAVKRSREDAGQRLARELDRAVEAFTREAETVISERLSNVGQTAAQRLDRRLAETDSAIAGRRDELISALELRLSAAEQELRQRLAELAADGEAQRGILEARLFDLQRRIDSANAHAEALER